MSVEKIPTLDNPRQSDTLFIQAQREYLGGHWEEAEMLLRRCLQTTPRDIEARLLLSTMLRHSRRLEEASEELTTILKFDESSNWIFEIRREERLLELISEIGAEDEEVAPQPDGEVILPSETMNP